MSPANAVAASIRFHSMRRRCRTKRRFLALITILSSLSGRAFSQEANAPILGAGFAVVPGDSGQQGCLPRALAKQVLADRILQVNRQLGIDPQIAVVFSSDVPTCGDLFYAAVANDVRGIGYDHFYETEIFDESPESALEGVAFLNDIPYWETHEPELGRAFLHEVGHRYGSRVHVSGANPLALLGRDGEHWSYFLDTESAFGVSPLEGNSFQLSQEGVFATTTDETNAAFSNLDLYLMGVLPPEDVGLLQVTLASNAGSLQDCDGNTINASSPPQRCESISLEGQQIAYTIEDVIAVEGERDPTAQTFDLPIVLSMGFYVLEPHSTSWTRARCEFLQTQVPRLADSFTEKARHRLQISVLTEGPSTCASWFEPADAQPNIGSSSHCSLEPGRKSHPVSPVLASILLLAWGRSRRTRSVSHRQNAAPTRKERLPHTPTIATSS